MAMGSLMAKYLAQQIGQSKLAYKDVVKQYPNLKEDIDAYLTENGMKELIRE